MSQTPSAAAITVRGLSKRYGRHVVLDGIDLEVHPGEVYALTGPNGAGKTTLIRTITGLTFPTAGRVALMGRNVHTSGVAARAQLGAVVEAPAAFYPHLSGRDNLLAHARLAAGAPGTQPVGDDRIREVLALLELTRMADRPVREYSLGQRQRLGVAAAILTDPKILILDEPTSGLDPLGIGLIHRIISSMAAAGTAVMLSTHHLREVASYAHSVGILSGGKLVDQIDLRARQSAYRFRVDDAARAAAALQSLPGVNRAYSRTPYAIAYLSGESQVPEAMNKLVGEGLRVYEAAPDLFDLYEYYRERMEQYY
ncbi:ABC-2 type transport system ATP-binding protein [Deinobacterium chartae]|uniref:ABC-2 type transport system ATP-binding protein n=1 Tax=Deinobacterium chartae TaxID=521158 RepID=A0A841I7X6_9DEIO|nr:ABC transporter ATP-binding protein [Deinobacterium chartae]MBB6099942.1 ABC-2 type transport system ATP-binding protein [Deinobacterium chartae]